MPEHIITLAAIRAHSPCEEGWRTLVTALGTSDPDTRLTIGDVAVANGVPDAMWSLRCIEDPRVRVAAVMPAVKRASAHTIDQRVHDCIAALERWLAGDDGVDLRAARAGALAAAAEVGALAEVAEVGEEEAEAAEAAEAAARAAERAAWAWEATLAAERAADARTGSVAAERERQREDLIKMFGLLAMQGRA